MSSEAITQNDLREILSRTVGSIPSEYKKLLWTNPSPTANFAPQTIALDLSEYDDIEVVATPFADLQYQYSVICSVGAGGNLEYQYLNTSTASNASTFINGVSRTFRVSTSGITFDNGQMTYNGGAYTNWQGRAIPYKIYGIKYERVAPPQVDASDYVIEQGTDTATFNGATFIWTYRKWSSGIAEAWTYLEGTTNSNGDWSPTAYCPLFFISTAQMTVQASGWTLSNANGGVRHAHPLLNNAWGGWIVDTWLRNGNANAGCGISWYIIGKWK